MRIHYCDVRIRDRDKQTGSKKGRGREEERGVKEGEAMSDEAFERSTAVGRRVTYTVGKKKPVGLLPVGF